MQIIECGADPKAQSHSAWTAVHAAAFDGYLVSLAERGWVPGDNTKEGVGVPGLRFARCEDDTVKLFVNEGGVDVNAVDGQVDSASCLRACGMSGTDLVPWTTRAGQQPYTQPSAAPSSNITAPRDHTPRRCTQRHTRSAINDPIVSQVSLNLKRCTPWALAERTPTRGSVAARRRYRPLPTRLLCDVRRGGCGGERAQGKDSRYDCSPGC
eukprot:3567033-Rhodomonas_salina.1